MSLADELRKLTELHQAGQLTDQEFANAKRCLIGGLGAEPSLLPKEEQQLPSRLPPPLPRPAAQRKKGALHAFVIIIGVIIFGGIISSLLHLPIKSQPRRSASQSNAPATAISAQPAAPVAITPPESNATPTLTPFQASVVATANPIAQRTPASPVEANLAANLDTDYKIGQEFKLGDYTYRITNFALTSRVGNEFSREVAEKGETFVVVSFTIRNDTNKTQQVLADDFQIKDGQGRQFTDDTNASTALMMSGGKKDFLLREIQPSLTGKGITVFRVPADVAKQPMVLVVPQKGLFSSKKVTVLLTKEKQYNHPATEAEYLKAMTASIATNKYVIDHMAKQNLGPDYPAKQAQVIIDDAKKRENNGQVTHVQYWAAANTWLEMGATPKTVGKLIPVFADTLVGSIDEPSMRSVSDHELPRLIGDAILGKQSALEKLRLCDLKKIKSTSERQDQVIQALEKRYKGANQKAKAEGEAPKP